MQSCLIKWIEVKPNSALFNFLLYIDDFIENYT